MQAFCCDFAQKVKQKVDCEYVLCWCYIWIKNLSKSASFIIKHFLIKVIVFIILLLLIHGGIGRGGGLLL